MDDAHQIQSYVIACTLYQVTTDGVAAYTQPASTTGGGGSKDLSFTTVLTDYTTFVECNIGQSGSVISLEYW
ncbi:MAG: hypothetical protein QM756_17535 [Polyangiaceae bacterium]